MHCKYYPNNLSHYIPPGSAFPRARLVPECQDMGKEFVWLAAARWRERGEGKCSRDPDKDHMASRCLSISSESKAVPFVCDCVCIVSGMCCIPDY